MTKQEMAALIDLLEAQNQVLVENAERIQAIETFLHEQPANASPFHTPTNVSTPEETKSTLQSSVQRLDKALKGTL